MLDLDCTAKKLNKLRYLPKKSFFGDKGGSDETLFL